MPGQHSLAHLLSFISTPAEALTMAIQFDLFDLDQDGRFPIRAKPWSLAEFKSITARSQKLAQKENEACPLTLLETHDAGRCVSRFGDDAAEWRERVAKLLGCYQGTMSGAVIIYQGRKLVFCGGSC